MTTIWIGILRRYIHLWKTNKREKKKKKKRQTSLNLSFLWWCVAVEKKITKLTREKCSLMRLVIFIGARSIFHIKSILSAFIYALDLVRAISKLFFFTLNCVTIIHRLTLIRRLYVLFFLAWHGIGFALVSFSLCRARVHSFHFHSVVWFVLQ